PEAARAYNDLGAFVWWQGDIRRARTLLEEAVAVGDRLGNASVATYSRIFQIAQLFSSGEWDEGFRRADEFLAACDAGESHYLEAQVRTIRAWGRLARGA